MEQSYYDVGKAESFGSISGLRRSTGKPKNEVIDWMLKQDAYTLHRPIVRKFRRRKTYASGIDDLWQIDLVDLPSLARSNDGYRYLLMCIDVFSRQGRIVPLKSKKAEVVRDAFAQIISDRKPTFVQSDKGTEFVNATFQKLLSDNDIKFYTSENDDIKCALVERWIRTMMSRLHRYFTYKRTDRYIDVLQDLVDSYNSSHHSSIKTAPINVTVQNEEEIRHILYKPKPTKFKYKFDVGDTVRISGSRRAFQKGYRENWTEEVFKVYDRYPSDPPTYGLTDYDGEKIKGRFYAQELQRTVKDVFRIEKIVKTRKRLGKTEYFVKWSGYPSKFNSWVSDISQ